MKESSIVQFTKKLLKTIQEYGFKKEKIENQPINLWIYNNNGQYNQLVIWVHWLRQKSDHTNSQPRTIQYHLPSSTSPSCFTRTIIYRERDASRIHFWFDRYSWILSQTSQWKTNRTDPENEQHESKIASFHLWHLHLIYPSLIRPFGPWVWKTPFIKF